MSLALAPMGLVLAGARTHDLVPCYLPGTDEAGTAAAGYPGDIVVQVAAGPRICHAAAGAGQSAIIGVLDNYIPSGAAAAWYSLLPPRGYYMVQASVATSSLTWDPADIGLGVGLLLTTAADTAALRSKVSVATKEGTNHPMIFCGLAPKIGNDNTVSAANFPWLLLQFVPSLVFPYNADV